MRNSGREPAPEGPFASLRGLGQDDEAADLALLDVNSQLISLCRDVLEILDAGQRLRLVVPDDLGDHVAFFDSRGLGGAAVLDGGDEQSLEISSAIRAAWPDRRSTAELQDRIR